MKFEKLNDRESFNFPCGQSNIYNFKKMTNISKIQDNRSSFAISLNRNRYYIMPADKCDKFFCPLAVGCFEIYYVAVPDHKTTFSIDINTIIK